MSSAVIRTSAEWGPPVPSVRFVVSWATSRKTPPGRTEENPLLTAERRSSARRLEGRHHAHVVGRVAAPRGRVGADPFDGDVVGQGAALVEALACEKSTAVTCQPRRASQITRVASLACGGQVDARAFGSHESDSSASTNWLGPADQTSSLSRERSFHASASMGSFWPHTPATQSWGRGASWSRRPAASRRSGSDLVPGATNAGSDDVRMGTDQYAVDFPLSGEGRRSTTSVGRAVVADALRAVDPVGALEAEHETNWRSRLPPALPSARGGRGWPSRQASLGTRRECRPRRAACADDRRPRLR